MNLKNDVELQNTRIKLRELEARYEELQHDTSEDARIRELSLTSIKRLINQLKEEIAIYQAHQPVN